MMAVITLNITSCRLRCMDRWMGEWKPNHPSTLSPNDPPAQPTNQPTHPHKNPSSPALFLPFSPFLPSPYRLSGRIDNKLLRDFAGVNRRLYMQGTNNSLAVCVCKLRLSIKNCSGVCVCVVLRFRLSWYRYVQLYFYLSNKCQFFLFPP